MANREPSLRPFVRLTELIAMGSDVHDEPDPIPNLSILLLHTPVQQGAEGVWKQMNEGRGQDDACPEVLPNEEQDIRDAYNPSTTHRRKGDRDHGHGQDREHNGNPSVWRQRRSEHESESIVYEVLIVIDDDGHG